MTVIKASRGLVPLNLRELWRGREILYMLSKKDIQVRYKQTVAGVAWAVLQPVLMALVFALFFGIILRVPTAGIPYLVFVLAGLLPWQLVSHTVTMANNSLVGNENLLRQVRFPRLFLPMAASAGGIVDAFWAFLVLLGAMAIYGYFPPIELVLVPVLLALALASALAVGLWLSALNVRYRDVHQLTPFILQVWFFSSPIFYPSTLIPEGLRFWFGLNPLTGVIEGFRWVLFGVGDVGTVLPLSVGAVAILLITGLYYFRWAEQYFADVV